MGFWTFNDYIGHKHRFTPDLVICKSIASDFSPFEHDFSDQICHQQWSKARNSEEVGVQVSLLHE